MEYWNELILEKSWKALQDIKGKFDFILIGGWATYLWAKAQKSVDIDIVIDLYVPHYSKLILPLEKLKTTKIEGIIKAYINKFQRVWIF